MDILYLVATTIMIGLGLYMTIKLYYHLELRENRELLMMIIGLLIDLFACVPSARAETMAEMVIAYRISLIGRGFFGIAFVLYIGRLFHARFSKIVLLLWGTSHYLCLILSYFYKQTNPYFMDMAIGKYKSISLLVGDKKVLYYINDSLVFLLGFWGLFIIFREFFRTRKQRDNVQSLVILYYAMVIVVQGITFLIYELNYETMPNFTPLFRGIMACIYSLLAMKYHFISYETLARDTLMNDIGAGFIVLTKEYRILFYNDIAKEVFPELTDVAGVSPYSQMVEKAVRMREFEVERDGLTYRITADRIYTRKKLEGYSVLIVNVTDILQLEKQASIAREAKSNLLTNMAHELRTPLNALTGAAEMMLTAKNVDEYAGYSKDIQTAVSALNDSFDSIIDAFNEETQVIEPKENPYSVCTLLETVIDACSIKAAKKGVEFTAKISPNLYTTALGDDSSIRKALLNIISNAIRYTENGRVSFEVDSIPDGKGGSIFNFTITDTGDRLAKELFSDNQASNAMDVMTVEIGENIGVGLLLARRLIVSIGGTFRMRTDPSGVNIFRIKIPQKLTDDATIRSYRMHERLKVYVIGCDKKDRNVIKESCALLGIGYESVSSVSKIENGDNFGKLITIITGYEKQGRRSYDFSKLPKHVLAQLADRDQVIDAKDVSIILSKPFNILSLRKIFLSSNKFMNATATDYIVDFIAPSARALVVDDDYLNRRIAVQLLEDFKIETTAATSGYECIELIKSGARYDIIFMDYMMEGLDGIETTIRLKKMKKFSRSTKIIAFTANDVLGAKDKYLAAGMDGCLFKPAGRESFAKSLLTHLPKHFIMENDRQNEVEDSHSRLPKIDGVDPTDALKYVSGNVDTYLELLSEFSSEIYKKSARISELYAVNDYYDFTIMVHGIKSTSKMLGINGLSQMMADLEKAGNSEDTEFLEINLTQTLDYYESFVPKLAPYVTVKESAKEIIPKSRMHELLLDMKKKLEDFEMSDAEAIMDEIVSAHFEDADAELVNALSSSIDEVDYYTSLEYVEKLLLQYEEE